LAEAKKTTISNHDIYSPEEKSEMIKCDDKVLEKKKTQTITQTNINDEGRDYQLKFLFAYLPLNSI
jgi:hypothetical protein